MLSDPRAARTRSRSNARSQARIADREKFGLPKLAALHGGGRLTSSDGIDTVPANPPRHDRNSLWP
jgi:hypothetical protein